MRCKWQIENSTWRIVQKILYSPNRTNRSNRHASTRVPEYREIFLSVANEMQMADRKLYLADRPKNLSIRQIERIDQRELLFFPIESSWQYWTTLTLVYEVWLWIGLEATSPRYCNAFNLTVNVPLHKLSAAVSPRDPFWAVWFFCSTLMI